MKGYKVFEPDWTCRGFGYKVGETYEEDITPSCCNRGFHFCKELKDCFSYYRFDPNNKVAEVEALGRVDTHSDDSKCSTNKLHIIREVSWQEVLELVNLGKGNTGLCNSGNLNSGDCNRGNWNSGNHNSGNCNSGDCNRGNWNSGNHNSGNCNSGDCNRGSWNSGDWNKTNFSNGCFNTEEPKISLFDKPSDWTRRDWLNSNAKFLLDQIPKAECGQLWWDSLSGMRKNIIRSIPNFDADKFFEITGIKVD